MCHTTHESTLCILLGVEQKICSSSRLETKIGVEINQRYRLYCDNLGMDRRSIGRLFIAES